GVGLLLLGYGIGRWQDSPGPTPAAGAAPVATSAAPAPASERPSSPPPEPTVYRTLQAEAASELIGIQTQDTEDEGGGQNVGWIASGDSLRFTDFEFGEVPATQLEVRVASDSDGGLMEIRLDALDSPAIGKLAVTRTGGWQTWRTDVVPLTPVTGTHTVYLTFVRPDANEFVNLNWVLFKH
ncbi:MAG: carbohydrate-binding protein, partial [Actinoplanes sp.]